MLAVRWNSNIAWLKYSTVKILFPISAFEWHVCECTWHSLSQLPRMKTNTRIQNSERETCGGLGREHSNNYLGNNVQLKEINVAFPQDTQIFFMKEKPLKNNITWNMYRYRIYLMPQKPEFDGKMESYSLTCLTCFLRNPKEWSFCSPTTILCRNCQWATKKEVVCACVFAGGGVE